jgi:peroxiredoxin
MLRIYPAVAVAVQLAAALVAAALVAATTCGQQTGDPSSNSEAAVAPATEGASFPDLTLPADANADQLQKFIRTAKSAQPRNPAQYRTMQTAIRDASRMLMAEFKEEKSSAAYQQAELDVITSSVLLMTFFGEDAQRRTLEQVHQYLERRKTLGISDVQTGMMAAAILEIQPDKQPARQTYELLDRLLENDEREEMQALRLNIQANIRRLDLLGSELELEATALDGTPVRISDFAGSFVLVHFFATRLATNQICQPCLSDIPDLRRYYEQYQPKGLAIIGISLDEDRSALADYAEQERLPWPVIHDDAADSLKALRMQFGISQIPTVFLLNKEGVVVSLEARGAELNRLMQMLFESPTPAPEPPGAPDR